jgi:hypothetical protein
MVFSKLKVEEKCTKKQRTVALWTPQEEGDDDDDASEKGEQEENITRKLAIS